MKSILRRIFRWLLNPFKRVKREVVPERTTQQIANDKHRQKYRLEQLDGVYFVQYYFNGEWWYLRLFDEDYILEERRGQAFRILNVEQLENIITRHQEWLSGGRIFLPY